MISVAGVNVNTTFLEMFLTVCYYELTRLLTSTLRFLLKPWSLGSCTTYLASTNLTKGGKSIYLWLWISFHFQIVWFLAVLIHFRPFLGENIDWLLTNRDQGPRSVREISNSRSVNIRQGWSLIFPERLNVSGK